jgi:hypothetical protein
LNSVNELLESDGTRKHSQGKSEMYDQLEKHFIESWDRMERFFGSGEFWPKRPDIVEFMAMARDLGYDRKLRAGQSLDSFVVSRSRVHGLRMEQPAIAFQILNGQMTVRSRELQAETFLENEVKVSDRVRDLLERLSKKPIT